MNHRNMKELGARLKALRGDKTRAAVAHECNSHPLNPVGHLLSERRIQTFEDGDVEPDALAFSLLSRVYNVGYSDMSLTGLPKVGKE